MPDKKILIPSEVLEPIVTKTIREIFEHIGCGQWTIQEAIIRINSISHLVDNCGAIHCSIAINEPLRLLQAYEDKPEELQKMFKEVMDKHYGEGN